MLLSNIAFEPFLGRSVIRKINSELEPSRIDRSASQLNRAESVVTRKGFNSITITLDTFFKNYNLKIFNLLTFIKIT